MNKIFCPAKETPFKKGFVVEKSKQVVTDFVSLVKMAESQIDISIPLYTETYCWINERVMWIIQGYF